MQLSHNKRSSRVVCTGEDLYSSSWLQLWCFFSPVWVWSSPPTRVAPGLCSTPSVCLSSAPAPTSLTAPSTLPTTTAGTDQSFQAHTPSHLNGESNYVMFFLPRWIRISIPLPNAALTETTRFRWKQSGSGAGSMWAIDNGACHSYTSHFANCAK